MATDFSFPSEYSGVYGAQYNVDTDSNGLIETFDLTWSNFDEAYINSTMEEFIDGTGTGTLAGMESSQKGGCTLVVIHVHDPETTAHVSSIKTYSACNISATTDPEISEVATETSTFFSVPVEYEAGNQYGDQAELATLESQYTPSVFRGRLTYTDAMNSLSNLIESALSMVPQAANSLNFKKTTPLNIEDANLVAFESDTAKAGSTTISTTTVTTAPSESDSGY